jgi:hypothetical protein
MVDDFRQLTSVTALVMVVSLLKILAHCL